MTKKPTYDLEYKLKNERYKCIIGIDEAGRGGLLGPVVAAGVIISNGFDTSDINDSKKLSAKKREYLYGKITSACTYSVHAISAEIIDQVNILEATKMAMKLVVADVRNEVDFVLVDGNFLIPNINIDQKAVVNGDNISVSIAAASIIAKVTRDRMMLDLHKLYPIYGLDKHKGYGTKFHRDAIKLYGPCEYHRKTYKGVKEYL